MNRRQALMILGAIAAVPLIRSFGAPQAWAEGVDVDAILHDPDAPEAGNPKGDVTIVSYFDYNCPFCKKAEPDLEKVVRSDGKIRLVYKDWPILTEASVYGAQIALGAKYQNKYQAAHDAMMAIPGRGISKEQMRAAVEAAGVDMARLQSDLNGHGEAITALLRRTLSQAEAMGLQGTPVYLVGPYKVAAALDADAFRKVVAQARGRQSAK
ncbi:protein-disulfide isomerase [Rhodopseudomonas thermotolerans]|uniref:Protein-disulfide isomerase n=2 Tax=Rhodopseudomonas TaxID=1073 RepID=A0A336JNL2_9BRAD|nr:MULTISPECIES: DsbA family protein [Rhodopseudomonas]RED33281.1 protein-disulfide isomerase [Rhodopseudomonas pentothenatexigens]REF94030.1 protein-disulfide isomerase [Rhodopseudomonas thermotolerans]SSW91357.1 protein-disulfide isomerase [Rhodopseudomonas pentothenatexigens]